MEIRAPGRISSKAKEANRGFAMQGEGSVVSVVNTILADAIRCGASDVHIDPTADGTLGRLRIDGELLDSFHLNSAIHPEVIARIKVLAHLRSDEHQKPQDGRFRFELPDKTSADVRVSIAPTHWGENAVLRLLGIGREYTLEDLGFSLADREKIQTALARPYGMILVTGPTGSGKTTTLYTLIKMLRAGSISIVTLEDPIEYAIEGIVQIQVKPERGLTFGSGLRAVVRQDPDIIMVGEIRDNETAGLAVNTALTGHLLLSTLHTNDAVTALPRLLDMGVDAFLIASTVNVVIAQRLVRRICENCKTEEAISAAVRERICELFPASRAGEQFSRGRGCVACNNTGYCGRLVIAEILVVDDRVREAVLCKSSTSAITEIAKQSGMQAMREDGFAKAVQGQTTISEIIRSISN